MRCGYAKLFNRYIVEFSGFRDDLHFLVPSCRPFVSSLLLCLFFIRSLDHTPRPVVEWYIGDENTSTNERRSLRRWTSSRTGCCCLGRYLVVVLTDLHPLARTATQHLPIFRRGFSVLQISIYCSLVARRFLLFVFSDPSCFFFFFFLS